MPSDSWFSEFGVHGGPAAKSLWPKYNLFMKHVSSHLGIVVPHVEMKHVIASTIFLKGFGGLLFIFSSSFGAYLLLLYLAFITPVVYVFYNYDIEKPEFEQLFSKFAQNLALFGALLFFIGMQNSIPRRQPKKVPKSKKQIKLRCLVVHTVQVGESGNVNDSHLRILQHVHHSLSRSRFFGEAYKTLMRCELRLRIVFLVYHFVIFLGLQVWTGVVCELIFTNSYIYVLFVT